MYSKGPLMCRNISIQNRQMFLRFFRKEIPKSKGIETEEKKKLKKKYKSTQVGFYIIRSNAHERK